MKKRAWIYGFLAICVCTFFLTRYLLREGVTRENYLLITQQMTKPEIHKLIGGIWGHPDHIEIVHGGSGVRETWRGYDGGLILHFDDEDRIIWKEWDNALQRPPLFGIIIRE